jgi:hypothetical protein
LAIVLQVVNLSTSGIQLRIEQAVVSAGQTTAVLGALDAKDARGERNSIATMTPASLAFIKGLLGFL